MPEILEAEAARLVLEASALKRKIVSVEATDAWYLKGGLTLRAARATLPGHKFIRARRRGKQLFLDTNLSGPVVGLHLGMSGRVVVDRKAAGDPLLYASNRDAKEWYRFAVVFADGGRLALRDPRRLGAVVFDADEDRLGPDALSLSLVDLRAAVSKSRAPLKAVLMDQKRIAGLGNLLTDEALWRGAFDPTRPANSLDASELARLHRAIRTTLRTLGRRGGSHTGDLMVARLPGGACPLDGAPLRRQKVGGRTTYFCPQHQI